EAGWRELRGKLEEIVVNHAGGPIPFDRVVFEMATKGEAGCSLVSDSALQAAIRSAMIEHLGAKGDLDEISPGQPLRLKLMSALLRDAGDPDWQVLLDAQRGLPVGIKVYEEQTSWKLEMGPADVAKAWKANYESAAEHIDYVREHFDAEVAEGLMLKLDEDAFWRRYGDEAALSAIAVLVDEGPPQKKRVIHDASHEVMLNHRIRCLDKVRSPRAREKRYLLRFLKDHRCAALSVTGDISKAHRRFRHSPDEWGYLGRKASDSDAFVYVNCVGTFRVASAGYWWSRISGGGIRLMHHITGRRLLELLLYADDLKAVAGDRAGRRGIVISYASLAALGFPFKWAKTCGGFVVEWVGFETAYSSFKLGLSQRRAEWLIRWCMDVATSARTTWSDFSRALGRLGFGANALSWERPFLGPMYSWSAATRGKHGSLTAPVMIRVILRWLAERFQEGGRLQEPMTLTEASGNVELTFFSGAKAEDGRAYVGGYLWNGHEVLSWYAAEVLPSWAPWAFIKNDPQRTTASLELLGTLLCVKLWGSRMSGRSRSTGSITGATDNQGNTYAVTKLMSTKYALPILLMELSETLRLGSIFLDLRWVFRERNQWADDLTNGEFGHFPMDK
ncbi:unnamed protein product, partial [Symbiodinium pilosum]